MPRSVWNGLLSCVLAALVVSAAGCVQPHPDPPEGEALQTFISTAWDAAPPQAFRKATALSCRYPTNCLCPENTFLTGSTLWEADTLATALKDIELASAPRFDVLHASGSDERIVYWPVQVSIEMPCRLVRNAWGRNEESGSRTASLLDRIQQGDSPEARAGETPAEVLPDSVVVAEGSFAGYLFLDPQGEWTVSWAPSIPIQ